MLKDEKTEFSFRLERRNSPETVSKMKYNTIEISEASASWEEDVKRLTLDRITLKMKIGQLYAIIGPVGAGKVNLKFQIFY